MMHNSTDIQALTLIALGALLLLGLLTDVLGRRTPLPRVSLLMLFGFLIGPGALDLLPELVQNWFPLAADMALVMVGFLLGGKMTRSTLKQYGHLVILTSIPKVLSIAALVSMGLWVLGVPLEMALLLGGIAPATAPAATSDVINEVHAKGVFARTLLGVVAVDDVWGLVIFSLLLAATQVISGGDGALTVLLHGLWEIGGAILLGVGLGVPMAFLTGRIQPGEPTLVEALGAVFLCGGAALWLGVSFLLSALAMGITVANMARHHRRPFRVIEGIEWPFLIAMFVLSGAQLEIEAIATIGWIGLGYILLRILGCMLGVWIGGILTGVSARFRFWMGLALLPQAGVALGMALVAAQRYPQTGEIILSIVIGATVIFELSGPVLARMALVHMRAVNHRVKHVHKRNCP